MLKVEIVDKNKAIRVLSIYMPILISLCALLYSVYQGYENYQNNRLSKIPHLDFTVKVVHPGQEIVDDCTKQTIDYFRGIVVQNNGIGPAKIKTVQVFMAGQDDEISFDEIETKGIFQNYGPISLDIKNPIYLSEKEKLFLYKIPANNIADVKAFTDLVTNKIDIRIVYCSIFGDCWEKSLFNRKCDDQQIKGG